MSTPLTDAITALTTYANTTTGASDTTLTAAVNTLVAGYGGGGGGGGLPAEYQEVEYIDGSTAGSLINTGVQPTETMWAMIKLKPVEVSGDCIFGTRGSNDNSDWRLFNYGSTIYWDLGSSRMSGGSMPAGTIKTLVLGNLFVMDAGKTIKSGTSTSVSIAYDIYINGGNSTYPARAIWYYVKLYDMDTLVRDFVPCYRIADNVVGMYDLVGGTFYTSVGSNNFTAGPDV